MRISAIAIISSNNGIGVDNHLLFHIPGELPRLKSITMGHPVIMGRKTHESIGRVLPGRTNIIITRDLSYQVEGAMVVNSLEKAIDVAKEIEEKRVLDESKVAKNAQDMPDTKYIIHNTVPVSEAFILGGGQIFKEAMPITDRLYLTVVQKEVPADVFFPDYTEFNKVVEKEDKLDWETPYTFLTLEK